MSTADTTSSVSLNQRPQPSADSTEPKAPAVPKPARKRKLPVWVLVLACIAVLGGAGAWYWWQQQLNALPPYIAQANGRLEAEQAEIATKYSGRIAAVLAKEGDMVQAGAVLARMDTVELEAQLQSAKAKVRKAEAEKVAAEALIVQRISERTFQEQEFQRTSTLNKQGWATGEKLDDVSSRLKSARAAYDTAVASRDAAAAAILADQAEVARLQSQINEFDPGRSGRRPHPIQARAAGGGSLRGRPGPDIAGPRRCLHDDLRAGPRRRPARCR